MTYHLVIRPEADAEVYEASHWYEERRKNLGKEFLSAFAAATSNLRRNPKLYPIVAGEARRPVGGRMGVSRSCILRSASLS